MNRNYARVAALAFFLYLVVSPAATAAPRKGGDMFAEPGVSRIVRKIKNFFRGFTSQDELTPPTPTPPKP
jgi:hypothetical protein